MRSTEGLQVEQRRRPRIWRIVVVTVLIVAISEPIVMYLSLAREKEKRRAAAELTIDATAARTSSARAAVSY
jgi:hypothetical protein